MRPRYRGAVITGRRVLGHSSSSWADHVEPTVDLGAHLLRDRREQLDGRSRALVERPEADDLAVDEHDREAVAGARVDPRLLVGVDESAPAVGRVAHRVRVPFREEQHRALRFRESW